MFELVEHRRTIDTARCGRFTFQVGVDAEKLETAYLRVSDAQERFRCSPLSQVARQLEREVVATSVFCTNSIEGGALTEEETQAALDLDPADVRDVERLRVLNIKAAYDLARNAVRAADWRLDLSFVRAAHAAITKDIPDDYNRPGTLRDNSKTVLTQVGSQAHGGRYKPPQFGGDIRLLLESLLQWHQDLEQLSLPALIRAPLVHFYFELIHPFWDGNGRVGRVIEASILLRDGFEYAPFAQARYYLEHIDRYFTLFNACRKAHQNGDAYPNTAFVSFFLEGMRISLGTLHDRVNRLVTVVLFESEVKRCRDEGYINARQYAIVTQVLASGGPVPLADLRRAPWYLAQYARLTDKTKQRDLQRLRERALIVLDGQNRVWPGFAKPS